MEKYNSKRIPGEKKYIIYATILFFIIINLFFLPKSTEGIISLPENQNENPISPPITNNTIQNSENQIPLSKENNKIEDEKNNENENDVENNNNNNEDEKKND